MLPGFAAEIRKGANGSFRNQLLQLGSPEAPVCHYPPYDEIATLALDLVMILAKVATTFRAGNFKQSAIGGNRVASHTNSLRLLCVNFNRRAGCRTAELSDAGGPARPN